MGGEDKEIKRLKAKNSLGYGQIRKLYKLFGILLTTVGIMEYTYNWVSGY